MATSHNPVLTPLLPQTFLLSLHPPLLQSFFHPLSPFSLPALLSLHPSIFSWVYHSLCYLPLLFKHSSYQSIILHSNNMTIPPQQSLFISTNYSPSHPHIPYPNIPNSFPSRHSTHIS